MAARVHYERELKHQAFLALGSLEALGNPVGLLRGMGQVCQEHRSPNHVYKSNKGCGT